MTTTFELKRKVLDEILNNPQTIDTLNKSLEISQELLEKIVVELEQEKFIQIHQYQMDKESKKEYIEFIMKSNNMKIIKPKIKKKSMTQKTKKKRKGFKPPRFIGNNTNNLKSNIPKTTGMITKKSKSKLIGKKRKLNDDNNDEPQSKRMKYNNNNNNNNNKWDEKMTRLKYEENFLLNHIEKLRETNKKKTVNKKDENCLSYDELVRLTEKWTIATQEIIETIIKYKNERNVTISKLLQHFQIRAEQVRWNEENEEFV